MRVLRNMWMGRVGFMDGEAFVGDDGVVDQPSEIDWS